jgi:hypothetical protein
MSDYKASIISLEEARSILGSSYDGYSDEAIEDIIRNLEDLVSAFIEMNRESNS